MFCPKKCHDHLILGRRYALTSTAYKHLEIGINASYITDENYTIVMRITDNRDNRFHVSYNIGGNNRTSDIEQLVQSTPESISREIHDLIIEIVKIRNENVVKFTSHDTSIYIKPLTVHFMLDLEHCIKNALCSMAECI